MVDIVVFLLLQLLFIFLFIQEPLSPNSHFHISYIIGTLLLLFKGLGPFALLLRGPLRKAGSGPSQAP